MEPFKTIKHKFRDHKISPNTETLILGTFNPDYSGSEIDFFYGRPRNFLWKLLPIAFQKQNLKESSLAEKLEFMKFANVDFIDLISEVNVQNEKNFDDSYLDDKVTKWNCIISRIGELPDLKRVCFTRKTFTGIKNIHVKIDEIQRHCKNNSIDFILLMTPARYYSGKKQTEWNVLGKQ